MDINSLRSRLEARRGEWTRIADAAGVSRRTIYRIVNGKNMPNLKTMIELDDALGSLAGSEQQRAEVAA